MNKKKTSEPLFHIVKNTDIPVTKAWMIRIIAILLSLVLCAVITMVCTGDNPISIYATIFKGAFGSARKSTPDSFEDDRHGI